MKTNNSSDGNACQSPSEVHGLRLMVYVLVAVLGVLVLVFTLFGVLCLRKYRLMVQTLRRLQRTRLLPRVDAASRLVSVQEEVEVEEVEVQRPPPPPLQLRCTIRPSTKTLWKGLQPAPRFSRNDLNLLQLIKAGKEAVFYQARLTRGTCRGHCTFTCKISKEGVRLKHVEMEVSIMRKLVHHKNVLQLLDWNTTEGTLRTFLQTNRARLMEDPELQSLLTLASYHVALAMQHLRSKMVPHWSMRGPTPPPAGQTEDV